MVKVYLRVTWLPGPEPWHHETKEHGGKCWVNTEISAKCPRKTQTETTTNMRRSWPEQTNKHLSRLVLIQPFLWSNEANAGGPVGERVPLSLDTGVVCVLGIANTNDVLARLICQFGQKLWDLLRWFVCDDFFLGVAIYCKKKKERGNYQSFLLRLWNRTEAHPVKPPTALQSTVVPEVQAYTAPYCSLE